MEPTRSIFQPTPSEDVKNRTRHGEGSSVSAPVVIPRYQVELEVGVYLVDYSPFGGITRTGRREEAKFSGLCGLLRASRNHSAGKFVLRHNHKSHSYRSKTAGT
jgi:hypothetical protein